MLALAFDFRQELKCNGYRINR